MFKPDLKPEDYLEFVGVLRPDPNNINVLYIFNENGAKRALPRREARELVDSYPAKQRNCKIAFTDIRLKASVRAVTPTREAGVML